jgi:hypothetical protein
MPSFEQLQDVEHRCGVYAPRAILTYIIKLYNNNNISYTDMAVGAPVLLLLYIKETVPYRLDKNPCQLLRSHNTNPSCYKRKEALCQPPDPLALLYYF